VHVWVGRSRETCGIDGAAIDGRSSESGGILGAKLSSRREGGITMEGGEVIVL
jgi:hypothetical protein